MDDEAALLNAIYADPNDDLVRLVYADWLDEHDRPERAEFIRAQIELAQRCDGEAYSRHEARQHGVRDRARNARPA